MKYSVEEVMQYVQEEDVKFLRLGFCDVFGRQKNISIMPWSLERAFTQGIAIDGSAITGFGDEVHSDLLLHPEPDTLMPLPWRPEQGRVMQMYASITRPDRSLFPCDTRSILKKAVADAKQAGYSFTFGAEQEFYLFLADEQGYPTLTPCDRAGYMDIAPEDRGENVRREVCLTLEQMGITPESSHHEEGPGQNEIDFRYSDPLTAGDNAQTFQRVVKTIAHRNGLWASFAPKPLPNEPGSGFHINLSLRPLEDEAVFHHMIAGILQHIQGMTLFLNPTQESYLRLGQHKAPGYVSWSPENRSQLVRIPAATGEYRRLELRSPDPQANPYLAFALMIYAALDGIERQMPLQKPANLNLYTADEKTLAHFAALPGSYQDACEAAVGSAFIRTHVPPEILQIYCSR